MATCGTTKAPWGWWCSRDLNHDGPCAARQIPTPWGLAFEWVARRLPDRRRLVDAAVQLQQYRRDLMQAHRELRTARAAWQVAVDRNIHLAAELDTAHETIRQLKADLCQ